MIAAYSVAGSPPPRRLAPGVVATPGGGSRFTGRGVRPARAQVTREAKDWSSVALLHCCRSRDLALGASQGNLASPLGSPDRPGEEGRYQQGFIENAVPANPLSPDPN